MTPRLSIVIPVWNDHAALAGCLDRLRSPDAPPTEIIVCDATADPAERDLNAQLAAARHARLLAAPQPSRGAQLAAGAAAATGDIIVFSHADTHLESRHLHALTLHLDLHPETTAGAFHRDVASLYPALAWASPAIHWYMAELGILYGDQSPFIRRTALDRLGGYPALPLLEDVAFSDQLRHHLPKHELTLLTPTLPTSPRQFIRHGRLRTRLRNLAFLTAWRLHLTTPERLHQLYYHQGTGDRGQEPGTRDQGPGTRGQGPGARGQGTGARGR